MPNKLFIGEGEGFLPRSYGAGEVEVLHNENPRLADPTSAQWEEFWGMGDVNRDGVIDLKDTDLIAEANGSREGDANWNPELDLDHDGKVDIFDLAIAVRNFGLNIWDYFGIAREPDYLPLLLAGGVFAVVLVGLFLFK